MVYLKRIHHSATQALDETCHVQYLLNQNQELFIPTASNSTSQRGSGTNDDMRHNSYHMDLPFQVSVEEHNFYVGANCHTPGHNKKTCPSK